MEHQLKEDVKEAASQEEKDAKLAQQRAEEAKERGAEASSHSGESLKKKVTSMPAHVAKEKATEATNTVKGKSYRSSSYCPGNSSKGERQSKRNDGLIFFCRDFDGIVLTRCTYLSY